MKKSYIIIIITAFFLVLSMIWLYNADIVSGFQKISQYAIILILVGFALYIGFSRLKSERKGEPAEDELSKKILQKAASISFYISIYMWLAVGYFSDKTNLEFHTLIGAGILGMSIIFFATWLFYKIRGIRDA